MKSITIHRLPYYKYSAGIKKYDADLDVSDWNEYNGNINNSSKRIDPNDQIYNFNTSTLSFDINNLNDRLLMMIDEQIMLHLCPFWITKTEQQYENNKQWMTKQFPSMNLASQIRNLHQNNTIVASVACKVWHLFGMMNHNLQYKNKNVNVIDYIYRRIRTMKEMKQKGGTSYKQWRFCLTYNRNNLMTSFNELNFFWERKECKQFQLQSGE